MKDKILKKAILIRETEKRLLQLFSEGKLFGTVHTCIGQELTGATLSQFLSDADYVFSNHRCHGHFISMTNRVEALIAEIMGKSTGVCGGWGGSQHLCSGRFFSNGIQGGFVPIVAGMGLTIKLNENLNKKVTPPQLLYTQNNRQDTQKSVHSTVKEDTAIAVAFIGEGTLGEGTVYETANLISKWDLPVLIIIENNRFSQSTPQEITIAGEILDRFKAFGLTTFDTDTWDLDGLISTFEKAVETVRNDRKPCVVRVQTDRLMAHSKGDDDRPKELIDSYYERDVITAFAKAEPEKYKEYVTEATARIDAAVIEAEKAELAKPPVMPVTHAHDVMWLQQSENSETVKKRINEIIRECFESNMARDDRIIMLGEDILDPYGGSFKATKGLSTKFPDRVKGTSISEASIIGIGNGLSLAGKLPVCEIMFGDFMTLTMDQILNHAAKFPLMYNSQVKNPIIIRTPMGGGRGYGPTHSQSIEKHFLGIPQTLVLALNQRVSPANIYNRLFETLKQPAIVIENKMLYVKRLKTNTELGFVSEISDEQYPTVRIKPEGKADLTILCYGGMLEFAEEAQQYLFEDYDIISEVVCPTQLYPFNVSSVLPSVQASNGHILIVEEGNAFAAWGSEVVTQIMEAEAGLLKSVQRLNMLECPIPCCGPLEKQLLPNTKTIIEKAIKTCGERKGQ